MALDSFLEAPDQVYRRVVPRGLEPRTLRSLAVRSNQLSYETLDFEGCWSSRREIPGDFLGVDMRHGTAHEQWVGPAAPFLLCPLSIGKLAQNKRLPPSSCGVRARGVCHSRAVGLFICGAKRLPSGRMCIPTKLWPRPRAQWRDGGWIKDV